MFEWLKRRKDEDAKPRESANGDDVNRDVLANGDEGRPDSVRDDGIDSAPSISLVRGYGAYRSPARPAAPRAKKPCNCGGRVKR